MNPDIDSTALLAFLRSASDDEGLVALAAIRAAARRFALAHSEVETFLLENGLFPLRYQRQRRLFRAEGQLRLLESRVGLVGCGGLGGAICELLVRVGVGTIIAIDPDCFDETNLNRQLLCRLDNLGRSKAAAAKEHAARLNSAVEVIPLAAPFQDPSVKKHLAGCDLVFDGLDSVPARFELADLCAKLGCYLVHGAVSGWCGQVALVAPGSGRLKELYPAAGELPEAGLEPVNLAPTVNAIAAFQVACGLRFLLDGSETGDAAAAGAFLDLSGPELERWF